MMIMNDEGKLIYKWNSKFLLYSESGAATLCDSAGGIQ